ncbi:ankyrin repeat domain-containing protein [Streptomyces sp. NPDC058268]|uniref:ankyrin repeat domain-containing protein n=1 Tax=Streptomyces sp. NPDC058268 TaxID=3346413 RepID=UPI0036E65D34
MGVVEGDGWEGFGWEGWRDLALVRDRLERGADPHVRGSGRPLHQAAVFGSPEVVAELARRVDDVDAEEEGRTALWSAVLADRADNARVLAAAGADPWRIVLADWSPGRLSLAGPTPGLFFVPAGERGLTPAESAAETEARRLTAALGDLHDDGMGLAFVAGIDAAQAARRLGAEPYEDPELDELLEDPSSYDMDESLRIVGATDVPGGCIITQPWGYAPSMPGVVRLLSAGTVCYGLYAHSKSGDQGSITRDGVIVGWDLHPGGGPGEGDSSAEVLASYLYRHNAIAYSCAYVGLRPADPRAVTGPPDLWLKLPRHVYED